MGNQINIIAADPKYQDAIISLLQSESLPTQDLPPGLPYFFVASDHGVVVGAIGLEIYESNGLLRSLVVRPEYRKLKIASSLVQAVEQLGSNLGLHSMYLLTETAQGYFYKIGYGSIERTEAPRSLQQSSEFSHVCPVSAILMQKKL